MAERFLEVGVERVMYTTVNIVIDDQDENYKNLFGSDGKIILGQYKRLKEVAGKAAKEIVEKYEWEIDEDEIDVTQLKEVPKDKALQFVNWDAKNDKRLEP